MQSSGGMNRGPGAGPRVKIGRVLFYEAKRPFSSSRPIPRCRWVSDRIHVQCKQKLLKIETRTGLTPSARARFTPGSAAHGTFSGFTDSTKTFCRSRDDGLMYTYIHIFMYKSPEIESNSTRVSFDRVSTFSVNEQNVYLETNFLVLDS